MWFPIVIGVLVGYLLGNLNGAVCMSALMNDDVRSHGSGNAGLTNFVRNYGVTRALYVILIDAGKAVLACFVGGLLLQPYGYYLEGAAIGGFSVMLGHNFPALLGFRGGKGILSGLFIALVLDWRVALIILVVFFAVYSLTKYVSLGSVLAAVAFSMSFLVLYWGNLVVSVLGSVMGLMADFRHRGNILRLCKG